MTERLVRMSGVNASAGTFAMTLATDGEATDGHILSIEGGRLPERMPLLVSHWNDPNAMAGSITHPRRVLNETPKRLRAVGNIELEGEGAPAEVRRDLLHMVERGHLTSVSIRWDADESDSIARVNLPADHPAFVDAQKEPQGSPRRWGRYFRKWRALEGSLVAIGADPKALIGRAEATEGEVREFWTRMAADAAGETMSENAIDETEGQFCASIANLRVAVAEALELGATVGDILGAVGSTDALRGAVESLLEEPETETPSPAEEPEARAETEPAEADEPETAAEGEPDHEGAREIPSETVDIEAVFAVISHELDERDRRVLGQVDDLIDTLTGRVSA